MKILLYMINSRLRASLEARRSSEFFEFCVPIRRWGDLSGEAAIIVSAGESDSNPRIISEYFDLGNAQYQAELSTGISPPALPLPPKFNNPSNR
jgi:hypothetical protein